MAAATLRIDFSVNNPLLNSPLILKRFYRNDRKITISELHTFANITGLILLLFTNILLDF